MAKISVVLATRNEEDNIGPCLESVKDFASEIIVVDEGSTDKTVDIAKSYGAKVEIVRHEPIFHITKQKAIDMAQGDWILQLDADERVSKKLADEIVKITSLDESGIDEYESKVLQNNLFTRHQNLIEERDGKIGKDSGPYYAFFIPRLNYFLGKYLRYGGVYPDGVIRLVRRGKAYFPAKDVHEQMSVTGKVGWLKNDLIHMADPTFKRYIERNSAYVNLLKDDLKKQKLEKNFPNFINYIFAKPTYWFLLTLLRHKGILDGCQGIAFSFFSALRFPKAYLRYIKEND
jgi:glycosyltransferase involved in cell wall biosynthesis